MWLMVKTLDLFYLLMFLFVFSGILIPVFAFENVPNYVEFESPQIFSVLSDTMPYVNFDGEWSFGQEWKQSTLNQFGNDDFPMILRIGHFDDFLYVHVNNLFDLTNNKSADRTTVCLSPIQSNPENDYWCFVASRGINSGHTLEGNAQSYFDGNLKLISNPPDFIGVGGTSSVGDRYMITPHAAYEFKIPLDYVGKSYDYRILVKTVDGDNVYTFPENLMNSPNGLPSMDYWGILSSKDKTMG